LSKSNNSLTEIWRFNNGGRPPSWILKICSFCHAAFLGMPFCFLVLNLADIGQSVNELWPKKTIFKMAAVAISNFENQFLVT